MTTAKSHDTRTNVPTFIADWNRKLQSRPLSDVVTDPATAAVFSADIIVGFCREGSLASPRIDALTNPVVDLFRRAHAHGVRHFVLLQDTHHPDTPEFTAYPTHCVRGTAEAETIPELSALPFSNLFTVIEKNSLHPAIATNFDRWLDEHSGLRTAIVVGDCTDLCTYSLAMHLRLRANARNIHGFEVIVPANAVDTFDIPAENPPPGTMPHPGDFFHEVFLYHMALNGIQIVRELT